MAFCEVVWRPEVGTVCKQMETLPRQVDPGLKERRMQRPPICPRSLSERSWHAKAGTGPSVVEGSAGRAPYGRADMIYHVVSAHAGPCLTRVLFT